MEHQPGVGRTRPVASGRPHPTVTGEVELTGPARQRQLHGGRVGGETGRVGSGFGSDQHLGAEVVEIEPELVLPVLRVERCCAAGGGSGEKSQRHRRSVRQHDGDPVAGSHPDPAERVAQSLDLEAEFSVVEDEPLRGDEGRILVSSAEQRLHCRKVSHAPFYLPSTMRELNNEVQA